MGLFFTIAAVFVVGAIVGIIALYRESKEKPSYYDYGPLYLVFVLVPLALTGVAGALINVTTAPRFEDLQFTKYDKTVEVRSVVNAESKEEFVFDYFGEIKTVSSVQFHQVIKGDSDKMLVREVEKWSPANYMHFKTTTKRATLIMPKASQ